MSADDEAELFVRVWQRANYLDEVAEQLGLKKANAYSRAHQYRGKGIPLKRLVSRPKPGAANRQPLDYARLARIARGEE